MLDGSSHYENSDKLFFYDCNWDGAIYYGTRAQMEEFNDNGAQCAVLPPKTAASLVHGGWRLSRL